MSLQSTTVHHKGSLLIAVPSIHYCHVFASEVNRLCRSPETRPDAIAVELGHKTAEAAVQWLTELGHNTEKNEATLPVMLGLCKTNRMLRASLKNRALQLQRKLGKDLGELTPEILHRELGYASHGIVFLTPTDSIIEAIRCALELNLPLHGVDLEEMPNRERSELVVQDPIMAHGNLAAYVRQNAPYAAKGHDIEIDPRREIAMAARLKALMELHRCVLFVCGMGHWLHIRKHINDPSIRPAVAAQNSHDKSNGNLRRVIAHPLIAVRHMDLFPAMVSEYEEARKPAFDLSKDDNGSIRLNPHETFKNLMQRVYSEYFHLKKEDANESHRHQDLYSINRFETYLGNLCLVNLQSVPDLFLTLQAAKEMMSQGFTDALIKVFMDFPWFSPQQLSYPLLAPSSEVTEGSGFVFQDEDGLEKEGPVYLYSIPESKDFTHHEQIPFDWDGSEANKKISVNLGYLYTWPPWDFLITSLACQAASLAKKWEQEKRVEVFDGSLLDGLAIKETIRSMARGEDRLYVYDNIKKRNSSRLSPIENGFPVVFILSPEQNAEGGEWTALYIKCDWMKKYMANQKLLEKVMEIRGDKMITLICYGHNSVATNASRQNHEIRSDQYNGILLYQPSCWENEQFAGWMEQTRYQRNPYFKENRLTGDLPTDLYSFFKHRHHIDFDKYSWQDMLVLLALPFAKDYVTVVMPDEFKLHPIVLERAKTYGVEICPVSFGSFSQKKIERIKINHMAPAVKNDPRAVFDEAIEQAIGEKSNEYRELVPDSCLNFLKNN